MTAVAVSLARPVVQGLLPLEHAEAAIAVAILNAEREGTSEGSGTLEEKLNLDCHLLKLCIDNLEADRYRAIAEIERVAWPMIRKLPPLTRQVIRAAAHEINGERGFLLSEPEVEGLLINILRQYLKPPYQPKRRPRG